MSPIVIRKVKAVSSFRLPRTHRLPIRQLLSDGAGRPGPVALESGGLDRPGGAWPHRAAPRAGALPDGQLHLTSPTRAEVK